MMMPENAKDLNTIAALKFYREHTAQIEVLFKKFFFNN